MLGNILTVECEGISCCKLCAKVGRIGLGNMLTCDCEVVCVRLFTGEIGTNGGV